MTSIDFADLYKHNIVDRSLQPHFVILISFLVTFVAVRTITHRIRSGKSVLFLHNIQHGETHIHHLVPGILLLLVSGYVLATIGGPREVPAAVYGVGAALTLDEFALWLQLKDVYWDRKGRESINAVIVFAVLAAIGGICARFLFALAREVSRI